MIILSILLIGLIGIIFEQSITIMRITIIGLISLLIDISQCQIQNIGIITFMDGSIREANDIQNQGIFLMIVFTIQHLLGPRPPQSGGPRNYTYLFILSNQIGIIGVQNSMDWQYTIIAWELFGISQYLQISTATMENRGLGLGAAIKYFIQSALTSSIFLIAIAISYYFTGRTDYIGCTVGLADGDLFNILFQIPFLFKQGIAPFHLWAPDLYENMKIKILTYIMIIPKIGLISWLYLYNYLFFDQMIFFAIISIFIGGIGMISQINIKRFLTFSSIAQQGYILMLTNNHPMIYMYSIIIYASSIYLIQQIQNQTNTKYLSQQGNIYNNNKIQGIAQIFILFSMAGFPPFAGFFVKYYVLNTLLDSANYFMIIIIILISIISTSQYLKQISTIAAYGGGAHNLVSIIFIKPTYLKSYLITIIMTGISIQIFMGGQLLIS